MPLSGFRPRTRSARCTPLPRFLSLGAGLLLVACWGSPSGAPGDVDGTAPVSRSASPEPTAGPSPAVGPGAHPVAAAGGHARPLHLSPTFSLQPGISGPQHSVVLISLDTASAPHFAAWGGRAEAPVLETLADRGVRFSNAHTHFPETCLSHWAMVSGVPPEVEREAVEGYVERTKLLFGVRTHPF